MCSVSISQKSQHSIRTSLVLLNKSASRRIHMSEASKSQRKEYISAIGDLGITSCIYIAKNGYQKLETNPRGRCLAAVIRDCAQSRSITIESGSVDHFDRQLINRLVSDGISFPKVKHIAPSWEPLLWLPDIIAWAYGRGGEWKKSVAPLIEKVSIV